MATVRAMPITTRKPGTKLPSRRVASRFSGSQDLLLQQDSSNAVSAHPDAIRRRKEHEERERKRQAERVKLQELEASGLQWWEGPQPANMTLITEPAEYKAALARATSEGRLLIAKFFTPDCYVCKSVYPKIKRLALEHPDVMWCKLNGADPALVPVFEALEIQKVPWFHMVVNGELVSELSASLSPEKLNFFRAELAAHKAKAPLSSASSSSQASMEEAAAPAAAAQPELVHQEAHRA